MYRTYISAVPMIQTTRSRVITNKTRTENYRCDGEKSNTQYTMEDNDTRKHNVWMERDE